MKLTKTFLISSGLAAGFLTLMAPWASSQPPAAGASGGRGGGMRGSAVPYDDADNNGFQSLFDGKTLNGWDGAPGMWDVKDGAIHIDTACEHPTGTTYIIWTGGEAADFILKYDMKGTVSVNGGMQFRSFLTEDPNTPKYPPAPGRGAGGGGGRGGSGAGGGRGGSGRAGGGGRGPAVACAAPPPPQPTRESLAKWNLNGYQVDFDANNQWGGNIYEQGGRNVITTPGHVLLAEPGKPVAITSTLADKATLDSWFHKDDYNHFMVVAVGHTMSTYMNGHLVMMLVDNDSNYFRASGKIAPEVENTGVYWVKNIYLKKLQ